MTPTPHTQDHTDTIGAGCGGGEIANPYFVTGPALISFSGGRTSAYMLRMILDAHGGTLPDDVHVCFANTGKEREETLRFVHECETRWGVRVRWLERRRRRRGEDWAAGFDEVGYNSASRSGEPFAALIAQRQFTPHAVHRFCTTELKIRVMKCFMLAEGYAKWSNVVGLRADEPRRVERSRKPRRERWSNLMPLADAGASNRDVLAFWGAQPFDLALKPHEGNCDMCFLKSYGKLCRIEADRPGTAAWWAAQEVVGKGRFVTEYSYEELATTVRSSPELPWDRIDSTDNEHDAECGLWCGGEAA